MDISKFDYILPKEFIAQMPAVERDKSRLLVLDRISGNIEHTFFYNLQRYLRKGDVLVLNDTRVIPARIAGRRSTGGKVDVLVVRTYVDSSTRIADVLIDTPRKLKGGEHIYFNSNVECEILGHSPEGKWKVEFNCEIFSMLKEIGLPPLPPYIKRGGYTTEEDAIRYQTVYARRDGSIAAPTAGLHFTNELIDVLRKERVEVVYITLHICLGTFKPIKVDDVEQHKMDEEHYEISQEVATLIRKAKAEGRRIVAVGTTTVRTLESLYAKLLSDSSVAGELSGWANLFIYPPYKFKIVDALVTNFHLPRGTPLLLTCAFASREKVLSAYEAAKKNGYRFYSYGDAMLIV